MIYFIIENKKKSFSFADEFEYFDDTLQSTSMFDECLSVISSYFSNTTILVDEHENGFNQSHKSHLTFQESCDECDFTYENEPSLLEELEIYPDRIIEKSMAMLTPFQLNQKHTEQLCFDIDLPGPILMYLVFGVNLFLAGKVFIFDHIYKLSIITTIGIYGLLKLMSHSSNQESLTIKSVASTLGYGMVNMVWLSTIGIVMDLNSVNGLILSATSVLMATVGTSQLLCAMANQTENSTLISFPIALIYALFSFLVVF